MTTTAQVTQTNIYASAMLSYIAYTDETETGNQAQLISDALGDLTSTANGPFTLEWGPINNLGMLAFVAQGADASYTLALRGTVTDDDAPGSWSNVIADLSVTDLAAFPYPSTSNANVAWGSLSALESLVGATDPTTGVTLIDFLRSISQTETDTLVLNIAGHSLGADLTNLAGPWIVDQYSRASVGNSTLVVTPYTFAAPTTTDSGFQTLWTNLFGDASYAAVNQYDVVPMAWTDQGITNILATFAGGPQLSQLPWYDSLTLGVYDPLSGIQTVLESYDAYPYVSLAPSQSFGFAGWAASLWGTGSANNDSWPEVVQAEHSMSTYVLAVCDLLSDWSTAQQTLSSTYGLTTFLMPSVPSQTGQSEAEVRVVGSSEKLPPVSGVEPSSAVERVSLMVSKDVAASWRRQGLGWKNAMGRYIPRAPS